MKYKLQSSVCSLSVLIATTLLCSLLFSCLYYFSLIETTFYHTICWIAGIFSFGISGAVLGMKVEKKALLHAFSILILLALLCMLTTSHNAMSYLAIASKLLSYLIVCMLVYTKCKKV